MKKSKLAAVVAVLLSLSIVAAACKTEETTKKKKSKKDKDDEEIEETEETDDEETEKTKETTEETTEETTTEEPTTTTTEEPTTTTTEETTTVANAVDTTDTASTGTGRVAPSGYTEYTFQDIAFFVTDEFQMVDNGGNYFFLPDATDAEQFIMAYGMQAMSPVQAKAYGFEQFMDEFNASFTQTAGMSVDNVISCEIDDSEDLNKADVVIKGDVNGTEKELHMRVMLDVTTGYAYCIMLNMRTTNDASVSEKYISEYETTVDSIVRI